MRVAGLLLGWLPVLAATLRVPEQYPSIQSALDACSERDTVLVEPGIYAEALVAPPFSFTLLGAAEADSLLPVIDPSPLPNPQNQRCLLLTAGECRLQNIAFRNGAAMHPHQEGQVGGIECSAPVLRLTNCHFDSVCMGLYSADGGKAILANCIMSNSLRFGIRYMFPGRVVASECVFQGDSLAWSLVTGYDSSSFVDCSFSGSPTEAHLLLAAGANVEVVRCSFQLQSSGMWEPLYGYLYESRIDSNLFADLVTRAHAIILNVPCDHRMDLRGNVFSGLRAPHGSSCGRGSCIVAMQRDAFDNPCEGTVLRSNLFSDCHDGASGKAIIIGGALRAETNRFDTMRPDTSSAVYALSSGGVFRDNIIAANGIAVDGDPTRIVDAEWNYWGDATGPYHPTLNPEGLGDMVGDFVEFDPWYTDTLFWNSATPEPHPQLPDELKLSVYPNPFNATTTLELYAPKAQIVEVKLYDLLGREVMQLFKGPAIGATRLAVNGADLASGIYFANATDPIRQRNLAEAKLLLLK